VRRLVAEIGSANGDLQYALDCVDAFADAGVSMIKGQLYTADTLTSKTAKPYGKGIVEPATQHEAFSKTLDIADWAVVQDRCDHRGIKFFASVFNVQAVDTGVEQRWSAFKIASGDITYRMLIEQVAEACEASGASMILSTGGSTLSEIERAYNWIRDITKNVYVILLVCTLSYPTKIEDAHVDRITTFQNLGYNVGYSDHTRGIAAADYAYRLGATMVEKHVTLTPGAGGDHDFAITPADVKQLMAGEVTGEWDCVAAGDSEIRIHTCELDARIGARRSLHAAVDIVEGDTIRPWHIRTVRPGGGIEPYQLEQVDGSRTTCHVAAGTMLDWSMLT